MLIFMEKVFCGVMVIKCGGGDTPFLSYLQSGSFACIKINYRLSSESKWPAQLYDCKAAIRWIKGNAERFGFDKNKIAVQGVLAGGPPNINVRPNKK